MRKLRLGLSSREAEIVETVYLDSAVLDEVLFAASRTALEIVGALAGYAIRDAVYISSWKHLEGHVSEDEFRIETCALVGYAEALTTQRMLGIIHSHPSGQAVISLWDSHFAARSPYLWLIVARNQRLFRSYVHRGNGVVIELRSCTF